ncbi:MAG: choice-of-anchor D domain-containing protein, partial [Saprospiraceae bacterium]|nr:choice-of-anchor D domain-containing protein [Saprospiraceae bacterium]
MVFALGKAWAQPDINVQGYEINIANGDNTPAYPDGTFFGQYQMIGGGLRTFTIENTGTSALTISTINVTGAAEFTAFAPTDPIAAGSSATFDVNFFAFGDGIYTSTIEIVSDDPDEASYTFDVNGEVSSAEGPEILLTGNSMEIFTGDPVPSTADGTDFGNVATGSFLENVFNISNIGNSMSPPGPGNPANLNVSSFSITGTNASDFTIINTTLPDIIEAGQSEDFTIKFTPGGTGMRTATISINNSDPDEAPYEFAVKGTGTAAGLPDINVQGNGQSIADGDTTPDPADGTDFGSMTVGGAPVARTFTVQNIGTANLSVTGITLTGAGAFSLGALTPASPIPAGSSASFTVTFDPTSAAVFSATVEVANSDPDENPYSFNVQGTGVTPPAEPNINVQGGTPPISISNNDDTPSMAEGTDFGDVCEVTSSVSHDFTIQNTGASNLTVSDALSNNPQFTINITLPLVIPAAGSAMFSISFDPSAAGPQMTTIGLLSDDPDEIEYFFDVAGNGIAGMTFYADMDGDGFGSAAVSQMACSAPMGFVSDNTDCDDANPSVNPSATEICNNIDDDCANGIDDGLIFQDYYLDGDDDSFGAGAAVNACQSPGANYVLVNGDCDDANPAIFPGATELCDGL